jgi:hypothetical protein
MRNIILLAHCFSLSIYSLANEVDEYREVGEGENQRVKVTSHKKTLLVSGKEKAEGGKTLIDTRELLFLRASETFYQLRSLHMEKKIHSLESDASPAKSVKFLNFDTVKEGGNVIKMHRDYLVSKGFYVIGARRSQNSATMSGSIASAFEDISRTFTADGAQHGIKSKSSHLFSGYAFTTQQVSSESSSRSESLQEINGHAFSESTVDTDLNIVLSIAGEDYKFHEISSYEKVALTDSIGRKEVTKIEKLIIEREGSEKIFFRNLLNGIYDNPNVKIIIARFMDTQEFAVFLAFNKEKVKGLVKSSLNN